MIANMVPGQAVLKGYVDGVEFASENIIIYGEDETIVIVNLYATGDVNPGKELINNEDPCLVYEICDNTIDDDQDTLADCDDPECAGVGSCP